MKTYKQPLIFTCKDKRILALSPEENQLEVFNSINSNKVIRPKGFKHNPKLLKKAKRKYRKALDINKPVTTIKVW